jgi:hypothetical protein
MARKKRNASSRPPTGVTPVISFRLSTQILAEVDARAKACGLTRSKLAAALLTQALARRTAKARAKAEGPFPRPS